MTAAGQPTESSHPIPTFVHALCLASLAGWVDATGYIHIHGLFVSFMSGNTTQAAVAATAGDLSQAAVYLRTILLFVAGVTLGELISAGRRWGRPLVLAVETVCLAAVTAMAMADFDEPWIAALLALAMGLQNAAVHKAAGISVALTYVTGTLVHLGRGLAAALRGEASWRAALPFAAFWFSLICGGFAGAATASRSFVVALAAATGLCAALALYSLALTSAQTKSIEGSS